MKKFAKMSLVAAVAVAGMASTVSAKDLSEAIQGVDFSGSVTYRYDERNTDAKRSTGRSSAANSYKIVTNTKVPVNDDVTFNTQINVSDIGNKTTEAGGDTGAATAREIYFTYTGIQATSIKLGKQAVDTPFTDAHDYIGSAGSGEQAGEGIAATVNAGPVAIGLQYFNDTDFTTDHADLIEASIAAAAGPVNLSASYMDIQESGDSKDNGWSAYYLEANGKVAGWSLMASYSASETEAAAGDIDANLLKLTAKGKIGPVGVKAGFATNSKNEDGSKNAYDVDAKSNFLVWSTSSNGKSDYTGYYIGGDMNVSSAINVALVYADSEYKVADVNNDFSELIGQVAWKLSSNFSTYLRYAAQKQKISGSDDIDYNRGRIQIKYDF